MLVNVGDVLAGKYRVDRILGIGGMGMVVAATHLELDQRRAIKFMLPDAAANASVAERFVREAKAAGKLRSEHICRVTDYGKLESGAPYIVMELMEGEDLAGLLLRRGALPVAEAVDYMLQALEGLADAHGNGIVHRDLKPGNLFVAQDADGSPLIKVLDFGISKSSIGGSATRTGEVMGSPAYMAPEQMMSAKTVDVRADLWAIGVILYQLFVGKLPWESESLPALCMMVMNEAAPSPATVRRELPAPLAAVVLRCLEKAREARFASVAELAAALAPFGGEGAAAAARRVAKVLGKGVATMPEVAAPASSDAAVTVREGARGAGAVSTMSGSAAELTVPPAASSRRGRKALVGGVVAVALIGGVIAVAAVANGGDGANHDSVPVTQPSPSPSPSLSPSPSPSLSPSPPPAPVSAPPPAPAVTLPTPTPAPTPPPRLAAPPVHRGLNVTATRLAQPSTTPPPPPPPAVTAGSQSPPSQPPSQPNEQGSGVSWTHMLHDKNGR